MKYSKNIDMKLKLGNLMLAILLCTVPTAITYGALSFHGLNICSSLTKKIGGDDAEAVREICNASSWDTTKSYIFLIGFFITLPTWLWFYLSVRKKKEFKN